MPLSMAAIEQGRYLSQRAALGFSLVVACVSSVNSDTLDIKEAFSSTTHIQRSLSEVDLVDACGSVQSFEQLDTAVNVELQTVEIHPEAWVFTTRCRLPGKACRGFSAILLDEVYESIHPEKVVYKHRDTKKIVALQTQAPKYVCRRSLFNITFWADGMILTTTLEDDVQSICRPKKSWIQVYGRTIGDSWKAHWVAVDTACSCSIRRKRARLFTSRMPLTGKSFLP